MKKIIFSGINLLIFIAALYALDNCAVPANSDLVEVRKIRTIHTDVAIPTMTLTDEMRAGLFFERLRVDTSVIRPKAIRESINPWEPRSDAILRSIVSIPIWYEQSSMQKAREIPR